MIFLSRNFFLEICASFFLFSIDIPFLNFHWLFCYISKRRYLVIIFFFSISSFKSLYFELYWNEHIQSWKLYSFLFSFSTPFFKVPQIIFWYRNASICFWNLCFLFFPQNTVARYQLIIFLKHIETGSLIVKFIFFPQNSVSKVPLIISLNQRNGGIWFWNLFPFFPQYSASSGIH